MKERWFVYDFEDGSTEWIKGGYSDVELLMKIQEKGNVTCKLSYTI